MLWSGDEYTEFWVRIARLGSFAHQCMRVPDIQCLLCRCHFYEKPEFNPRVHRSMCLCVTVGPFPHPWTGMSGVVSNDLRDLKCCKLNYTLGPLQPVGSKGCGGRGIQLEPQLKSSRRVRTQSPQALRSATPGTQAHPGTHQSCEVGLLMFSVSASVSLHVKCDQKKIYHTGSSWGRC